MKNSAQKSRKKKSPAELAQLSKKLARREKLTCGKRVPPTLTKASKERIVAIPNQPINRTRETG